MDINSYKPTKKLNNKHLLTLLDYSSEEIFEVLKLAEELKFFNKKGKKHTYLSGKTIAIIFAKSSTRTRVSFEQGIRQLGAYPMFLSSNDIQLGRGEPISDTVKVLERYNIDAIMIRTFKQSDLEDLAKYGTIPIINGLTDDFHPCQALADYLTVYERFGKLQGLKLVYMGDGNNVAHSLMIAGAKLGVEVVVCCPKGFEPSNDVLEHCLKHGKVSISHDPKDAVKNASVIYTDVFFSMGQEKENKKMQALMPYQVNDELMAAANPDAIFMHCLPAKRNEEVTSSVVDGPQSVIFEQAENRLHAQKAVMRLLLKNK